MDHWLEAVPPVALYLVVLLVVGVESLGIPLPGEVVLISAALFASQGHATVWWVGAAGIAGAIIGDSIGFLIGARHGDRMFAFLGRRFPRHAGPAQLASARRTFERWGVWAVFVGRFVALLRIFAGPLAGSLNMHYRKFLLANASGGIVWAGGVTALVYTLGIVAKPWIDRFSYAALGVAVVGGIAMFFYLRHRAEKAHGDAAATTTEDPAGDGEPAVAPRPAD
ncbi:DedA family protein [Jatrophihabitans sp. YIM 134969]